MKLKDKNTEQKLRGGYYTPKKIADFIVEWALSEISSNKKVLTMLEPSCGDGIFLESTMEKLGVVNIDCTAVELLNSEAEIARNRNFSFPNMNIINNDFFDEFEKNLKYKKFDLILGNPPYIRYQYLTEEQRETQSEILVKNGMKSNKLINAWVSFVVASVQILNTNGKIGMVIPAELFQVAYAEDLRLFLVDNLSKITIVTFEELVFPDVQQEVVLLLGENKQDGNDNNFISVLEVKNTDTLEEQFKNAKIEFKKVDHNTDKWTKYFLTNDEIKYINQIKQSKKFVRFDEIADVDIGITTGNNKYFSVEQQIVENYGLQQVTLPLIGRSAHASGLYFNKEDWLKNVIKGVAAQLVYFPNEPFDSLPENYQRYIKYGESLEMNTGYKCRIRENWYHIPSVWVPDAFFLRRNNKFPKFVLNDIDAVSTDTMHRVRFKNGINRDKALLAYYNSITFAFTEIEGRSYGGGVLEILPSEVEKIMLPNIQSLDDGKTKELIELIDKTIRNNEDIEKTLNIVDSTLLIDYLGIEEKIVLAFRLIWRKLMNRRLNRKLNSK